MTGIVISSSTRSKRASDVEASTVESLLPVRRDQNTIAVAFQRGTRQLLHHNLIVHHQDGGGAPEIVEQERWLSESPGRW